jgi:hypothetical protein
MSSVPGVGLLEFITSGSLAWPPGRAKVGSISPRRPGPNTLSGEAASSMPAYHPYNNMFG